MTIDGKFLLIKPPYNYFPLGLAYVASTLERSGVDYEYLEYNDGVDLPDVIKKGNFFAVGAGGLVNDFKALEIIFKTIKEARPDIPCIMGGPVARDITSPTLFNNIPIDYAVLGEAELTLPQLIEKIVQKDRDLKDVKGIVYRNPESELGFTRNPFQRRIDPSIERVFPSFDFYDKTSWDCTKKLIPVLTGRGCKGRCLFCSPSHRAFLPRHFDDVFQELDTLITKYNPPEIFFANEIMFVEDEMVIEFCQEYKKRFQTPFSCLLRLDVHPKVIGHLKDAGCIELSIGIESGNDQVLKRMGKGISVSQVISFMDEAKKLNLTISSGFMIGNQDETKEEIDDTLTLHEKIDIRGGICFTIPYPGTPLFSRAQKKGLFEDELTFLRRLPKFYNEHQMLPEILFWQIPSGKSILPNLTSLPDDVFINTMRNAYVRFHKKYALQNPKVIQKNGEYFMEGTCPICGVKAEIPYNPLSPIVRSIACPNVALKKCYNNFEFHADVLDGLDLVPYKKDITEKLKRLDRIALYGDNYIIKYLLCYGVFDLKLTQISAMCSHVPERTGTYLWADGYGNITESSQLISVQDLVKSDPQAIVIALMPPLSERARQELIAAGIPSERIFTMSPTEVLPTTPQPIKEKAQPTFLKKLLSSVYR